MLTWLFQRMVKLGREIIRLIVEDDGPEEILRRISDPYWFQSLGCVLGLTGIRRASPPPCAAPLKRAFKEGLRGREQEWGLVIAGGKGATSRKTPAEIVSAGEKFPLSHAPEDLVYLSRLTASGHRLLVVGSRV